MRRRDRAQQIAARAAGNPLSWICIIGLMFSWPIVRSLQAASELPDQRPVVGSVPEFSLEDHVESELSSESLRGVVWIASFTYSSCRQCTPTLSGMRALQHRVRQLGPAIKLVTFTLDPAADGPDRFAAFASEQRASTRMWSFVTGSADELEPIYEAFGVTRAPQMRVFVVDGRGDIRGFYDLTDPASEDLLIRDVGLLVNRGY